MKKNFSLLLAFMMMLSVFAGCGSEPAEPSAAPSEAPASSEAPKAPAEEKTEGLTIPYPANMQERGFEEALTLEKMPERIISMSKNPVLALYELGIDMLAIPNSGVVSWPEDLEKSTEKITSVSSAEFDIESVIAMEPDLVFMGFNTKDKYGKTLDDAGIPVYYVDAGPSVDYASVKAQTEALVDGFAKNTEEGRALLNKFTETEERLKSVQDQYSDRKVMVLASSPPDHSIQTNKATLGSLAEMAGLKNVFENSEASSADLDMEAALTYDPDLILVGSRRSEPDELKELMEADFEKNKEFWGSLDAVKNGDVIYVPRRFMSSTGIGVLDNINEFIEMLDEHYKG